MWFDYLVIACWIAVLTVVGFAVRPLLPASAPRPGLLATDLLVLAVTVLPAWAYLTITEAGPRHATFGKRATRLWVLRTGGQEPTAGPIGVRNAVKLAPWQVAHLAVARFMLDVQVGVGVACYLVAMLLVVLTVWMAVRDPWRRGLHDRVAGTRVVSVVDTPALRQPQW